MNQHSLPPFAAPGESCDDRGHSPPDVEAIMCEVRKAAAQSQGQVEDYSSGAGADRPAVKLGIDDQALVERVMKRLLDLPSRGDSTQSLVTPLPRPEECIARNLGFDAEKEHGTIHRLLGKTRRWLFRTIKIQAEFEKMYERINGDLMELERRSGARVLELQQWIDARLSPDSSAAVGGLQFGDPLELSPEQRWQIDSEKVTIRSMEYVPFVRETLARSAGAAQNRVMDVGCGDGTLISLLGDEGIAARGIDAEPLRVRQAESRGLSVTQSGLREFLKNCAENEFRCVLAIHLLEFVAEPLLDGLINEFRRILVPGGRLVIEVPRERIPAAGKSLSQRVVRACESVGFSAVMSHAVHAPDATEQFALVDDSLPGAGQFNAVIEKLNATLCGPRDVLIIADK